MSDLEAKFPLNFSRIPNAFGQGYEIESIPSSKILRFKH